MTRQAPKEKRVLYLFNAVIDLEKRITQLNGMALTTVFAGGLVVGVSVGGLGWLLAAMAGGAGLYRVCAAWASFHKSARLREAEARERERQERLEAIRKAPAILEEIETYNLRPEHKLRLADALLTTIGSSARPDKLLPP